MESERQTVKSVNGSGISTGPPRRNVLLGAGAAVVLTAGVGLVEFARNAPPSAKGIATFVDRLCDITLPDTGTPGARKAGVPAFIARASATGMFGSTGALAGDLLAGMNHRLGHDFLALAPAEQLNSLLALDARTFSAIYESGADVLKTVASPTPFYGSRPPRAPVTRSGLEQMWWTMKQLIIIGYYTTEVGGSQELTYNLVPGRYDADIPLKPGDRQLSNNWVANIT